MLYPIELIFYEQQGQEGVELTWADGTKTTAPTSATNLNGFTLIPAASLYAADVRASLYAQNTDSAAAAIAVGTHLTYTAKLTNLGTVAASNHYTVLIPTTVTVPQTLPAGCTTSAITGATQLVCTGIAVAVGATQTFAFNGGGDQRRPRRGWRHHAGRRARRRARPRHRDRCAERRRRHFADLHLYRRPDGERASDRDGHRQRAELDGSCLRACR